MTLIVIPIDWVGFDSPVGDADVDREREAVFFLTAPTVFDEAEGSEATSTRSVITGWGDFLSTAWQTAGCSISFGNG